MKQNCTALKGPMIVGLVLVLFACSPKIVEHTNVIERVDTVTKVIKVPVEIQVPVEVHMAISTDYSFLETSVAESEAYTDSLGRIHHTLSNKDVTLRKDTIVTVQYVNRDIEREVVKEVEVEKELNWLQRTLIYIGIAALAILILLVCKRILWK